MSKRAAAAVAIGLVAIGLLLAGCGEGRPTVGGGPLVVANPANPAQPGCPAWADPSAQTSAKPLPAGAIPTAVRRCGSTLQLVPGDGEWSVALDERSTAGLPALLTAMRLPSAARTDGMCPANLVLPTVVVLELDGRPTPVAPPVDTCGRTRQEVSIAYAALGWTTVTSVKVERTRTQAAVAAGCEPSKDVIAIAAADPQPAATSPTDPAVPLPAGTSLKVCRYATAYPNGTPPANGEVVDGSPVGGSTLGPDAVAQVNAALAAAGPAAPCPTAHSRFAMVFSDSRFVAVELDGCHRLALDDYRLLQGTKALADLLAG